MKILATGVFNITEGYCGVEISPTRDPHIALLRRNGVATLSLNLLFNKRRTTKQGLLREETCGSENSGKSS